MKRKFVNSGWLVCPHCLRYDSSGNISRLRLIDPLQFDQESVEAGDNAFPDQGTAQGVDEDIKTGILVCGDCKRFYPIVNGVGIFTPTQGDAKYKDPAL